jgi:death-on-curing protein
VDEPIWLSRQMIDAMHSDLIEDYGGSHGIRAGGNDLIDSALSRPMNRFAYTPGVDLADVAAAYLFGLVKNHGFIDGNKRIAFAALVTFLDLNGRWLTAPPDYAFAMVVATVEDRMSEGDVAEWIRRHWSSAAR